MLKWLGRLIVVAVFGSFSWTAYELYRGGYFSLPDLPDGAVTISFNNGLRAVVLDADVGGGRFQNSKYFRRLSQVNPDRRYLGVPLKVAPWFEDAWSFCVSPTESERTGYRQSMPAQLAKTLEGARFDAVCRLDVDGQNIVRGLIYSVPRL